MSTPKNPDVHPIAKLWLWLTLRHCSKCKRPNPSLKGESAEGWAVCTDGTLPIGATCPDCQTAEERADLVMKESVGDRWQLTSYGQIVPKNH